MIIDYKLWLQPFRIALPIGFMLASYYWAKRREPKSTSLISPVIIARLSSAFVFLIFSIPVCSPSTFALPDSMPLFSTVCLIFIAFFVIREYSHRHVNNIYPEVQAKEWHAMRLITNDLSWIIYLFGYEVFFRGFLLSESLASCSLITAVVVNVTVYALSHFHKGSGEVMASIPFGLLLCLLTIASGSVWCAFILHTALALSNEWFSINNKFFSGSKINI